MIQTKTKSFSGLVATLLVCLACLGMLAGCAVPEEQVDAAEKNRDYMMQANNAMIKLNSHLEEFTTAASTGDVVSMQRVFSLAEKDIESFKALPATDATKDIHAEYLAGCEGLKGALKAYLDLYAGAESIDDAAFEERLAQVQQLYDEGIKHLQDGDGLVSQLPGALPSESSSGASDAAEDASASSESAEASEGTEDGSSES